MQAMARAALLALVGCAGVAVASPSVAPEFTHRRAVDWLNSEPLTLAKLKGKVVLVEFWAFECVNCLNSAAWLDAVEHDKGPAGLVIVGVHTPELPAEKDPDNVRRAVQRLRIHHPVMIDEDYTYWKALHNKYWPGFYLIGRDGMLYGSYVGEMHQGEARSKAVEDAIDQLLAAPAT
jgi:thiol-disulfide isomerase/thioredoxin